MAFRLIRAMNTTQPTTRPTYTFIEFMDQPLHMFFSRLFFLNESNPTDPLVPGKRRKILPG